MPQRSIAPMMEQYTRTFSTYSGANIAATFNGRFIAELQGITYSVSREKGPIYTLGSADPRGFGRGKRGVAGSFVFTTFNREALLEEMKKVYSRKPGLSHYQTFISNISNFRKQFLGEEALRGGELDVAQIDALLTNNLRVDSAGVPEDFDDVIGFAEPEYHDQLPPFHVSIVFANEQGMRSRMEIFGVEIINEGSTMTVDDLMIDKAMTFVARKIKYLRPMSVGGRASQLAVEQLPSGAGGYRTSMNFARE